MITGVHPFFYFKPCHFEMFCYSKNEPPSLGYPNIEVHFLPISSFHDPTWPDALLIAL